MRSNLRQEEGALVRAGQKICKRVVMAVFPTAGGAVVDLRENLLLNGAKFGKVSA
jgi:hypothetical protein